MNDTLFVAALPEGCKLFTHLLSTGSVILVITSDKGLFLFECRNTVNNKADFAAYRSDEIMESLLFMLL